MNEIKPALILKDFVYIHSQTIEKRGAKEIFQIKLPFRASIIKGILITGTSLLGATSNYNPTYYQWAEEKYGAITLRLNEEVDVFHAEDIFIRERIPIYEFLIGIDFLHFGFEWFSSNGFTIEPLSVKIKPEQTFIQAYYQDYLSENIPMPYKLKIYIYFQKYV